VASNVGNSAPFSGLLVLDFVHFIVFGVGGSGILNFEGKLKSRGL
jgi:hypothetical protein